MATEDTLEPALQEPHGDPDTDQLDRESQDDLDPAGSQRDSDDEVTLEKRLKDKDAFIIKLQNENKELKTKVEPPKPVTKEDETDFKIYNAERIRLCKPEYDALRAKGLDPAEALDYAEAKRGIRNDTSEASRQASTASAPGLVSRSSESPVRLTEHDKRFGLSAERKRELKAKYGEYLED